MPFGTAAASGALWCLDTTDSVVVGLEWELEAVAGACSRFRDRFDVFGRCMEVDWVRQVGSIMGAVSVFAITIENLAVGVVVA